jgi:N-acetylneuraminic acid mutarotase
MRRRRLIASGLGTLAATAGGWRASAPGARARAQTIPAAAPGGRWITVTPAPLPEAVEELFGVAVTGKMYAFQGLLPGFRPAGLMYEYDPGADAWTKKKPMARPLHHAAAVPLNGKIYSFGGFVLPESGPPGWVPVNDTWEYDPAGDAWRPLPSMPAPRHEAAMAALGNRIHVAGGDVQSAIAPPPKGASFAIVAHDVFEVAP